MSRDDEQAPGRTLPSMCTVQNCRACQEEQGLGSKAMPSQASVQPKSHILNYIFLASNPEISTQVFSLWTQQKWSSGLACFTKQSQTLRYGFSLQWVQWLFCLVHRTDVKRGQFLGPVLKRGVTFTCQLLGSSQYTTRKPRLAPKEACVERNGGPCLVATLNQCLDNLSEAAWKPAPGSFSRNCMSIKHKWFPVCPTKVEDFSGQ